MAPVDLYICIWIQYLFVTWPLCGWLYVNSGLCSLLQCDTRHLPRLHVKCQIRTSLNTGVWNIVVKCHLLCLALCYLIVQQRPRSSTLQKLTSFHVIHFTLSLFTSINILNMWFEFYNIVKGKTLNLKAFLSVANQFDAMVTCCNKNE